MREEVIERLVVSRADPARLTVEACAGLECADVRAHEVRRVGGVEEVCLKLLVVHVVVESATVVAVGGDELRLLLLLQEFLFSVVGCLGGRLSLQLQFHGLRRGRARWLEGVSTTLRRVLS